MGLGVTPDVLTSAKALGAGFPISAMLTLEQYAKHLTVGTHGTTFGGNPLSCAVANKAFDLINTPELLVQVKQKEKLMRSLLAEINQELDAFKDIRGSGLLLGVELSPQYQDRAKDILIACSKEGLLVLMAGSNVVRFTPALTISEEEIKQGLTVFKKVLQTINRE